MNPTAWPVSFVTVLWVAAGGAIGSVGRYAVRELMPASLEPTQFPWATFTVNVTGSLILGWLFGWAIGSSLTPSHRAFLIVGVLGGFTTFSTFAFESLGLIQSGQYGRALLYIGGSVALSIGAAALGFGIGRA